jgi:diadenylate cyclase
MTYLSANRIGALIAMERRSNLDAYARSGTLLSADFSVELLCSLCHPGSLLHDGCVILRGQKICAAKCILPLSSNEKVFVGTSWGTRHRAGLGLTEVTDAIVFIVSEQSGIVSAALHGEILVGAFSQSPENDVEPSLSFRTPPQLSVGWAI